MYDGEEECRSSANRRYTARSPPPSPRTLPLLERMHTRTQPPDTTPHNHNSQPPPGTPSAYSSQYLPAAARVPTAYVVCVRCVCVCACVTVCPDTKRTGRRRLFIRSIDRQGLDTYQHSRGQSMRAFLKPNFCSDCKKHKRGKEMHLENLRMS